MPTQISHSGGLVDAVIELGFDQVKYFEGPITDVASTIFISPPARRIVLENCSTESSVFLRINDEPATANVSFTPGDDVRIQPGCTYTMDYDAIHSISMIAESGITVDVKGLIGFKGTVNC